MDWDDLRHFAALARTGSLTAAARELDVEHATVGRRIASLEKSLKLILVDRRGRRWSLTDDGERIATIARRMEAEEQAVRRAAIGAHSELTGTVTITAPPALASALVARPLALLRKRHPGLILHILGETRIASLEKGEADIALRLSRPTVGNLTIVKLGKMHFYAYGSHDYLAEIPKEEWQFVGGDGELSNVQQLRVLEKFASGRSFSIRANTLEIQQAVARAGGGIAILPDFMAATDSGLVAAYPDSLITRELWLAVHSDLASAAAIRTVINCLKQVLGN
jgi:DNA-binding transcriptional LysR family regulator